MNRGPAGVGLFAWGSRHKELGTSRVVAGLGAGVFDAPLPIGAQKLEAQAVARWIDYAKEFRLKFDRRRRSNERSKTEYWTR